MRCSLGVCSGLIVVALSPLAAALAQGRVVPADPFGATATAPKRLVRNPPQNLVGRLGRSRLITSSDVENVAFSPDGKLLAALERRGTCNVWNALTGELQRSVVVEATSVGLSFSDDAQTLFAGRTSIDLETGRTQLLTNSAVVATSNAGRLVAALGKTPNLLVVWRPGGDRDLWSAPLGSEGSQIAGVAFSPSSDLLAVATSDNRLTVVEAATGKTRAEHSVAGLRALSRLAFSPDGRFLAASGATRLIALYELERSKTPRLLAGKPQSGWVSALAFSPDGRWLASAAHADDRIRLWDVASGREATSVTTFISGIRSLGFSPDGKQLVAGGTGATGPRVQVWNLEDGVELFVPRGPRVPAQQIAFASNDWLAAGCPDGRIHIWDGPQPEPRWELQGDCARHLGFSLDGAKLAAVGQDGALRVWNAAGENVAARNRSKSFSAASVAPSGDMVAWGASAGKVELESAAGEIIREITAFPLQNVQSLAFSPDGKLLAAEADDARGGNKVRVWDAANARLVREFSTAAVVAADPFGAAPRAAPARRAAADPFGDVKPPRQLAFSPSGDLLAASRATGIHLWHVASGVPVMHLPDPSPICFAPSGRYFVSQQGEQLVMVDSITMQNCLTLDLGGDDVRVLAMSISPDGRLLACSVSTENTVLLLSLAPHGVDPAHEPSAQEIDAAWQVLADPDAQTAYKAAWTLTAAGDAASDYLRGRFRPQDKPDIEAQRIARLIAGLDDEQFRVREQASSELEVTGSAVLPLLERALSQGVSPEQKFRITRLLASIRREAQRPEGEPLRRLRAIGILERIDSRAAGAMLDEFAAGPPDTTETLEAQSALARRKSGDFRSEKR